MADSAHHPEKKESAPSQPVQVSRPTAETPKEVTSSRVEIAGALVEGQEGGEIIEAGEVKEMTSEGKEVKGDAVTSGAKKQNGTQSSQAAATATSFTFDEKNLPPVPEMIRKIEDNLRSEIRKLERDAKRYQGGLLRKPDPIKLSETMIQIRKKNVLLKRIVTLASDALKRMFLQMFGAKK